MEREREKIAALVKAAREGSRIDVEAATRELRGVDVARVLRVTEAEKACAEACILVARTYEDRDTGYMSGNRCREAGRAVLAERKPPVPKISTHLMACKWQVRMDGDFVCECATERDAEMVVDGLRLLNREAQS